MQERFRQIREYYGLSQAQFAQKINMSPGFISNVETGRSNISDRTINAICKIFPIDRAWLLNGEGEMLLPGHDQHEVDKVGVGERVKKVRKWAGLTQIEFAQRIGYSKMQVLFVEKEKVTPSNQFLEKIVSEFKISSEWLFTGTEPMLIQESGVDDRLISWLNEHPDVIRELRERSGLE